MITRELINAEGAHVATVVLHKGRVAIKTTNRALERRLRAFFEVPETLWSRGVPAQELPGSEAHFTARLRALSKQGLRATL